MDLWFIDDESVWSIPDSVLPQIAAHLRAGGADVAADVIEVAVETGAVELGVDDRERPALRSAVEKWAAEQRDVPEWASAVLGT